MCDSKIGNARFSACEYKGDLVSAKSKSPESTEKNDESGGDNLEDSVDTSDESSGEAPVLIEDQVEDINENAPQEAVDRTSDNEAESFPPDAAPVIVQKRASFLPGFLGGLIAASLMVGGAFYLLQDRLTGLGGIDTNASGIAQLTAQVEELGASIPTVPPLSLIHI